MERTQVLQVGSLVNIERASKQIHKAYVSHINEELGYVNVEWSEDDKIRGKDITLLTLQTLNPNIAIYPLVQTPLIMQTDSKHDLDTFQENDMPTQSFKIPVNRNRVSIFTTSSPNQGKIRRKSCVKEIDRIRENRDERRLRQAQELSKKVGLYRNPNSQLLNMITEYRRELQMSPLTDDELDSELFDDHQILVCVRKRPFNARETARKEVDVITIPTRNQLILHEPKNKVDLTKYLVNQSFRFDYVFDEMCSNATVYRFTARPLVNTIFEGGFSTCFAYGQTGSGKTHTMGGDIIGKERHCQNGIYAMAAADVFELAASPSYKSVDFTISASYFEIYSSKVYDLLNAKSCLKIMEDGRQQVQIIGLTERVVSTTLDVLRLITIGNQNRTSGQTSANIHSSRSHAIFQIMLRKKENIKKVYGKFSLIDLAGNERGADTSSSDRHTRMEGGEINKSLLALKECIRAMGRKGAHLPFRVSKLTQVLRDSFVGSNSKTCMIAMISPGNTSCEHSLNTLRYADRVKELRSGDVQTNQEDYLDGNNERRIEEGSVIL